MTNIIQIINDYNIENTQTGKHSSAGWVNINCPFCNDKSFHGGFNLSEDWYNCWKCGTFSIPYVLAKILHLNKYQIQEILKQYNTHTQIINHLNKKKVKKHTVKSIEMIGEKPKKIHKQYLKNRGLNPNYIIDKYQITGTMNTPLDWKFRLVIPIFYNNKLISYQARDVTGNSKLRYKVLSPELSVLNNKHIFYGLEFAGSEKVAIVEGIFDQWKMGDNFIAAFGSNLTNQQIKLLTHFKQVFFLFDSDAIEKAKKYGKMLQALKNDIQVEVIDLELGNRDCGDLDPDEVRQIKKELRFF